MPSLRSRSMACAASSSLLSISQFTISLILTVDPHLKLVSMALLSNRIRRGPLIRTVVSSLCRLLIHPSWFGFQRYLQVYSMRVFCDHHACMAHAIPV